MCISQPGWMKDSGTMNGGKFYTSYTDVCEYLPRFMVFPALISYHTDANYLLKCVQGYHGKGFSIWAISIQVGSRLFVVIAFP